MGYACSSDGGDEEYTHSFGGRPLLESGCFEDKEGDRMMTLSWILLTGCEMCAGWKCGTVAVEPCGSAAIVCLVSLYSVAFLDKRCVKCQSDCADAAFGYEVTRPWYLQERMQILVTSHTRDK
jgi:hypothetical protein